jgi:flagellar hook assembly protein FlgD
MAATDAVSSNTTIPDWMVNSNPKPVKAAAEDGMASKETFLRLLVAQLRNQNPLEPTDGVQFLSQLAQFSDLEQTIRMREELTAIRTSIEGFASEKNSESDGNDTKKG